MITIGLPTYNESKSIAKLLEKINSIKENIKEDLEVFIVNDGSNDDTEYYLKDYAKKYDYIKYVNHFKNLGLAQGMRTIIDYGVNNLGPDDIIITLDADNTHNPNIIPAMVDKLILKNSDVIIASRFIEGGDEVGLSSYRKLLSRGASTFANIFFNIKDVKDYSCGYRAYNVGFLKEMASFYGKDLIQAKGFECMIELIIKANLLGANIEEYPLVLEYDLKETPSKMKAIKTIKGYFRLGLKYNRFRTKERIH